MKIEIEKTSNGFIYRDNNGLTTVFGDQDKATLKTCIGSLVLNELLRESEGFKRNIGQVEINIQTGSLKEDHMLPF